MSVILSKNYSCLYTCKIAASFMPHTTHIFDNRIKTIYNRLWLPVSANIMDGYEEGSSAGVASHQTEQGFIKMDGLIQPI